MMTMQGRARRPRGRTWGVEALEGRRLMTAGLMAQFAAGWGDAVDVRFPHYTTGFQESAGRVPITITRGGDLTLGASARVRTSTVDAVEGHDYVGLDQPVVFAPGSATATFYLTILDDDVSEPVTKALYLQVYQTSDVVSTETVASMMVLIGDDEAASLSSLTFHAFGDAGLWTYNDVEGYRKINDAAPEAIYSAPGRGAYLDFGASGLWYWNALTGYEKLNDADPQAILTSDRGESLLIDFGAGGLWRWSRAAGFSHVADVDPKAMAGSAERGLVDFGPAGLWSFTTVGWAKLDDQSPEAIAASDGGLFADYGDRGLWQVISTQLWVTSIDDCVPVWRASLQQINPADPTTMTATDNGLIVGFGDAGLWKYGGGSGWTKLNDVAPRSITVGINGLYLNYGEAGLWRWSEGGVWSKLHDLAPSTIATVRPKVPSMYDDAFEAIDVLDLDYGDAGLWRWSSAKGWKKQSPARVTAMDVARNDTGVSYGIIPA